MPWRVVLVLALTLAPAGCATWISLAARATPRSKTHDNSWCKTLHNTLHSQRISLLVFPCLVMPHVTCARQ